MLPWPDRGDYCAAHNVTYDQRVFDPDAHSWCPVPGGGADALLFGALAVFAGALLYSKLSAVWALLAGAAFASLSWACNLGHFSNALTVWLGMHPTFLFFQIFLPPLLLDSAVRIDFFLFKKLAAHSLAFAVVNVLLSTLGFVPLMLYGPTLNLAQSGWNVLDAALMGAMLGSTDAVAVSAILKAGGAPEMLSVLLECESLFNDATSILLFEVFLKGSLENPSAGPDTDLASLLPQLMSHVGYLMISGAASGLAMGLITRLLFKVLHKRHVPPHVEVATVLAGAYTVYLGTEFYVHGSGVIAVVVYGLYGAASYQYGLSSKGLRTGALLRFFDVLSFSVNGMVFFYVGSSIVNFFLSLSGEVFAGGSVSALLQILSGLPVILGAMFLLRGALMWLEGPLLSLLGPSLSWQEVVFSTVGGLRGGLALILVQTVVAAHTSTPDPRLKVVHAQMALWVSGVVLFTLTVNAAALGPLMRLLGLNKTTPLQRKLHRGAYAALSQYSAQTIADLRCDDDEMLRGVDWKAVRAAAHVTPEADKQSATHKTTLTTSTNTTSTALTRDNPAGSSLRHELSGILSPLLSASPRSSIDAAAAAASVPPAAAATSAARASFRASRLSTGSSHSSTPVRGGGHGGIAAAAAGGGLTVPLLSRLYSTAGGRQRYGSDALEVSDDEEDGFVGGPADIEAGQPVQDSQAAVPSSSEAFFIASRLHQQDQQLAEHTATATNCPLLTLSSKDGAAAAAAAAAASAPADADTDADAAAGYAGSEAGESDALSVLASPGSAAAPPDTPDTATAAGAPPTPPTNTPAAAAAAPAAGAGGGLQLQPLQPLIPVSLADLAAAAAGQWQQRNQSSHSAADGATAAAAAVAATVAAMAPRDVGPPGVHSRASFIAAATGATTAAGVLGAGKLPRGRRLPQAPTAPPALRGAGALRPELAAKPSGDDMSELSEDEDEDEDQYLAECRASLLAGLKRHFRFKAAEGLLSKASLRALEYACDCGLSRPGQPLSLWRECGGDIRRWGVLSAVASLHLRLRRYQAALLRQKGGCVALRNLLTTILNKCSHLSRRYLGRVAVVSLEVALELWLALTVSPMAKLMRHSTTHASALLQEELGSQAAAVWRFIMDRQLEAPDEFAALQTHRVQLAVARRQLAFVERMAQIGAVDDLTGEELQELLERRLHRLEYRGPNFSNPSIMDVLRRLPYLAAAPEALLLWLRAYGELRSYQPAQCIIPGRHNSPPGVFIVLFGLVRVDVKWPGTQQESRFVGVGGSVGIVPSVLGHNLPGVGLMGAYAQGNALGRGPMVLHLPMRLLSTIRQRAAPGIDTISSGSGGPGGGVSSSAAATAAGLRRSGADIAGAGALAADGSHSSRGAEGGLSADMFAQLLLDMHRHVGVVLLDRMAHGQARCLTQHLQAAAKAVFKYSAQVPVQVSAAKLQRLMVPLLGGAGVAAAAGSGGEVADLLSAAFETHQCSVDATLPPQATGDSVAAAAGAPTSADAAAAGGAAGDAAAASSSSRSAGAGEGSRAGGDEVPVDEGLLELLQQHALAAVGRLRENVRGASLVTLPPGQPYVQTSSVLLLSGSLRVHSSSGSSGTGSGRPGDSKAGSSRRGLFRGRSQRNDPSAAAAAAAAAGGMTLGQHGTGSMRQYNAPALLAWGPELFGALEDRYDVEPQHATAGATGALMLVTPYRGTTVTAGGSNGSGSASHGKPGSSGDGSRQQQQQQQQTRGFSRLASHKLLVQSVAPALQPDEEDV